MQTLNDRNAYGWISIALHWLAAIGVLAMLYTGFTAGFAEDAHDRARHMQLMGLHIAIGVSFYIVFVARIAGYYAQPRPVEPKQSKALALLARATHHLLLAFIAVQIVSGPLIIWSHARPINAGFISIPSPFATSAHSLGEIAELLHTIGRWALVALIGLHIAGAFKHLLLDRDGLFTRIFAPGSQLKPKPQN
jgi:cytochrome b561